jgi:photosystem II stability/assembly factor-like uncharacterized protein
MRRMRRMRRILAGALCLALLCLILSGCGQADSGQPSSGSYGGPLNHLHDLLALRGVPDTVLLATHIGLYRSDNSGRSWIEVAGGSGQPMDGLMLFKFAESPLDFSRVYVLAVPRPDDPEAARATPGLYTSTDAGRTWKLAAAASAFPVPSLFSVGAGASSPGEVFLLVPTLGNHGVYVSQDAGQHWQALPTLPTTDPGGIWAMPPNNRGQQEQRLFLWSAASGLFESNDDGLSWTPASGVSGGIFSFSEAGNQLYANGDNGLYVSTDAGAHFVLAPTQLAFSSVVACTLSPMHAYGLTGTSVYVSASGGQSWSAAAATSQHPGILAADPANPNIGYVGLSYPLGVEVTTNAGVSWHQVLP